TRFPRSSRRPLRSHRGRRAQQCPDLARLLRRSRDLRDRRARGDAPSVRRRPDRGEYSRRASANAGSPARRALLILAILVAQPLVADSNLPPAYWANRQLPDAAQEARAQALMAELRCLVCQGQSIADSDAELAADMRDLVRRRIAAGERPSDIRSWLVQRYGSWISFRPTDEPA